MRLRNSLLVGLLATIVFAAPAAASEAWTPFDGGPLATCADGSVVNYLERAADPERVVLYFEGGGGCFSAETCAFDGPQRSYVSSSGFSADDLALRGGLFDFANPENPLAEHSFVYVPYCTGDVHLGAATRDYGDGVVVEHRGAVNAEVALDHLAERFSEASEVIVTGVSAGSVPTPLYAALVADRLPDARVVTLGDGSGAYPDDPVLNAFVGGLWGTMEAVPDWPEVADLSARDWSIPGLYVRAGEHAPQIAFGRFDFAYDEAQAFYGELAGVGADDLLTLIDANDAAIEAAGVPLASFTAPGSEHTVLWRDEVYQLEVEGVRLIDWISQHLAGDAPADVRCGDCR